jgi:hypothetical protein
MAGWAEHWTEMPGENTEELTQQREPTLPGPLRSGNVHLGEN